MANKNQGTDSNFPDLGDLWNAGDGLTPLPLHNEVSHSTTRDNGPSPFTQLQVSSSPAQNFHGETAHYFGHASADSLSNMMSNATQHNNLPLSSLHDPKMSGVFYPAHSKDAAVSAALNRSQSYSLNQNVQKQDAPSGIRNQLHMNRDFYLAESSDVKNSSALNRSQSYNLNHNLQNQYAPSGISSQLDVNRGVYQVESSDAKSYSALNRGQIYDLNHSVQKDGISPDSGGDLNNLSHKPHYRVMSGAPQVDNSNLGGRFLSLGNNDTAGSRWESYAPARHPSGSKIAFPPSRQVTSHSPFNPVENGGSYPQNLVPSGTMRYSNNGNRSLPGLTSGFDASTSLPSSGQFFDPNIIISTENGNSPVMGYPLVSRYTDTVSKAYQTIPSGLHSNNKLRSSESVSSLIPRLPSGATITSNRQQLTAEENRGLYTRSNDVSPFQSPTLLPTPGTSSKKKEDDQASQRFIHAPPSGRFNEMFVTSDNAVSSSSNKRSISITNEPRKLIRVGPSRFQVNPSPSQSPVVQTMNLNPRASAFPSISQQLIHQSLASPKTAPLQNTSGHTGPAITPTSNRFSINTNPKTIPAPQQIYLSKNSHSYPNSSPASTNTWYPNPSAMSPVQIANQLNSLERHRPQFGAAGNVSLSTNFPKPLPRTSMTLPHGTSVGNMLPMSGAAGNSSIRPNHIAQGSSTVVPSLSTNFPKMVPRTSMTLPHGTSVGNMLPMSGATGNSSIRPFRPNHIAQGSSTIVPKKRPTQALAPGPSTRTANSESAKAIVERFFETQTNIATSQIPYIKRQGVSKPEARGLKCMLCNRDLAYTPDGAAQLPACPPQVAVLPCGHVFHDQCLMAITPEDQRPNPPCIPCSINEPSA